MTPGHRPDGAEVAGAERIDVEVVDVAVIGAGVVGAAIARALSRFDVVTALVDAGDDVGTGTSKANTAIRHTGFDAVPGSLESALLRRGYPLLAEFAERVGIPLEETGAHLVAWDDAQLAALDGIARKARANGYVDARPVAVDELYRREPHLGPGARGALHIPGEGIICPFTTPLALATDAVVHGVRLRLGARVTGVERRGPLHRLRLAGPASGHLDARWVVNAAGLGSDVVDRLFGHDGFTITPRRGELIVHDKLARPLVNSVLLPVPNAVTKGVLVAPTVFGNVLLGPTAEDVEDRTDTATTAAGLRSLRAAGGRVVPALLAEEVTAVYAGLRAATEHSDYQLRADPDGRYVCVAGIRSTGLSASLGIAAHVVDLLLDAGLALLPRRDDVRPVRMPPLGEAMRRPHADSAAIRADPAFGDLVCHCERVTRGEIVAAAASPVPARTLDGLRRRTRALLGRCQGFACSARVTALFAQASGVPADRLLGLDGTDGTDGTEGTGGAP